MFAIRSRCRTSSTPKWRRSSRPAARTLEPGPPAVSLRRRRPSTSPISWRGWRGCCIAARPPRKSSTCRSSVSSVAERCRTVRVVSLVPSLTETLLAWGVEPVGCTRFCEQPSIAHVGRTKDPDVRAIAALAPDVVFMDREENRREDAEALEALGIELVFTHVAAFDDVEPMFHVVRRRLGLADDALPRHSGIRTMTRVGKSAFVAIWRRPWMTCNAHTYGSSLLSSIGVSNVFADAPDTYPTVTLADVAARRPDMILLPPEPYPFRSWHLAEIVDAIPDAHPRLVDGQDLFWWGARTQLARGRLAQALGVSLP